MSEAAGKASRVAGGAATGGGINFQAAVTAFTFVYVLRGRPLRWLEGICEDVPVGVAAETGGAGDDIVVSLRGGKRCEVQVKRGLRSGVRLWVPLLAMAEAISSGDTDFGVLAVSPTSSLTIREELATALVRIGEGRRDGLPAIATDFLARLAVERLDAATVCRALRIVTVSAMRSDGSALSAAEAELGHVCAADAQIRPAWNVLYRDALDMIDRRGRRDLSNLVQLLRVEGIGFSADSTSPSALLGRLCEWTMSANASFTIFGVRRTLSIEDGWIPLQAIVREDVEEAIDLKAAVIVYQSWEQRQFSREAIVVDPETLGRFIKLVVLVAGPGMGKTTLLKRIARRYAAEGVPVLRVRLSAVAARMRSGSSFEEAVLALGLDGSDISPGRIAGVELRNWVLLCDGLDETGASQDIIAEAAERFALGHPGCRVIVTTRPVGYHAGNLGHWRHYDIVPFGRSEAIGYLSRLLGEIGGEGSDLARDGYAMASAELRDDATAKAVSRSPLLLALAASLIARGHSLALGRPRLYERLLALVDESPNARTPEPPGEPAYLRVFLDALAWAIVADPIAPVDDLLSGASEVLAAELGIGRLKALGMAQSFLRYWQDVGLVERVSHGDAGTLTFIHKTFGEFAAGRHLAAMPQARRRQALGTIGFDDAWNEALGFAGLLGAADDVCAHLLSGSQMDAAHVERVVRCLEIVAEAEPGASAENRSNAVARALEAARAPRREWAVAAGLALVPVARRYPGEVAPSCAPLVAEQQTWTRLVGWAALCAAGPPYLDLDRLQSVLVAEASLAERSTWPSHDGGLVLGGTTERDIAQVFVLEAARQLLEQRPGQATDEAVVAAFRIEDFGTSDFLGRATRLLELHGKSYDLWPKRGRSLLEMLNTPKDYDEAQRMMHAALFDAIDPVGVIADSPSSDGKLLVLSAFIRLCRFWDVPGNDVWAWTRAYDPAPVRETVRAAIAASGLDPLDLERDVRAARSALDGEGSFYGLLPVATDVDVAPMDWRAAGDAEPDVQLLEEALYHRSYWLIWLAANIVDAVVAGDARRALIVRGIERGNGKTLWAMAALAGEDRAPAYLEAVYERLERDLVQGCEHLVKVLPDLADTADGKLLRALEIGLLEGSLAVAMASAEVAVHYAAPEHAALLGTLEKAAVRWKREEEPYPTRSGVIPDSPREKIAVASAAIRPPSYEEMKAYATDVRSDMRALGRRMLAARLVEDADLARPFLEDVGSGRLAPGILDDALKARVSWDDAALLRVEELLADQRPGLRHAAMGLLHLDYRSAEMIHEQATRLATDPDRQVRDRAFRILDALADRQSD